MRTSSRPVDMDFKIIGLFGITLDTSKFRKQDRVAVTIELAQAIMDKGGPQHGSPQLSVSRHRGKYPPFPCFPTPLSLERHL